MLPFPSPIALSSDEVCRRRERIRRAENIRAVIQSQRAAAEGGTIVAEKRRDRLECVEPGVQGRAVEVREKPNVVLASAALPAQSATPAQGKRAPLEARIRQGRVSWQAGMMDEHRLWAWRSPSQSFGLLPTCARLCTPLRLQTHRPTPFPHATPHDISSRSGARSTFIAAW